ncbi:MAG: magnesium transporter CorA family protein [Candidatus Bathyarchaeia archaeon]
MIRLVNLGDNSEVIVQPQELVNYSLRNVWLELVDPAEEEIKAVSDLTQLPSDFLTLPLSNALVNLRLEMCFTVLSFLVMQDVIETRDVYPVILAFSKDLLVSVAPADIQPIIDAAKKRLVKAKIDPPPTVAYYIVDEIIADNYLQIEKLEHFTSELEEDILEKTRQETLKKIFSLKSNMVSFNKILWYERGIIFDVSKSGDTVCLSSKERFLFAETHEDLTRQIDIVETYREILSDAINVHLSAVSNKINLSIQSLTVVIFYLTIVTTLTSFPNTVATFFGISQFGQTDVLIIAVALAVSIFLPFVWLWRKKWLKYEDKD